jgi:hypothetical protein
VSAIGNDERRPFFMVCPMIGRAICNPGMVHSYCCARVCVNKHTRGDAHEQEEGGS